MRLRKFRARAYRCIHDSGEIRVGDLAAFVGRNESGKTTILQALTLLNRDQEVSELDLCDEMTDELKQEIRLAEGEFELNHNEIVGFETNPFPNISRRVVWISDPDDHKQVLKRMKITFKLLENMKIENFYINIINSDKDNFITRSLKLIYITDWISYYLSDLNIVDPIPVDTIKKLKDKMLEGNK